MKRRWLRLCWLVGWFLVRQGFRCIAQGGYVGLCAECGPQALVDEDGCCLHCGASALHSWHKPYTKEESACSSPKVQP
jgi:hypothetical protein